MNKEGKKWGHVVVVVIISSLFTIGIGTLISLCSGYQSSEQIQIVKILVWLGITMLGYMITIIGEMLVILARERKSFKFIPTIKKLITLPELLLIFCATSILIGCIGSFDYLYVVTFLGLAGVIGIIVGIIKFIKKNEDKTIDKK